ncbi:MAG: hypothetical protein ABIM89_17785 [Mycobacteriales bacterium]
MNDIEQILRATLASTSVAPTAISGPGVRRLSRVRQRRAYAGGAAIAASATVVVAVGAPMSHDAERAAPAAEVALAENQKSTSSLPASPGGSTGAPSTAPATTTPAADPRVFDDVVAGAFPMPGRTQRRTIRVRHIARSIVNVACGGQPFQDLESTAARFDQARTPDLDLIADKGFVEQSAAQEAGDVKVALNDCVQSTLPSYEAWSDLAGPWDVVITAAVRAPQVAAAEGAVASCARNKYGFRVSAGDPIGSLMSDGQFMGTDPAKYTDQMRTVSAIFADCTRGYFGAIEKALEPERRTMVAAHRDLLGRFAAEIAAAGYPP